MKIKITCLSTVFFMLITVSSAFSVQYTFQPRVSASEAYTTNVFLSQDDEKDDFISIVSAGFTAKAFGKSGGLEVSYDPAYIKYLEFDENDTWRHDAKLRAWSDMGRKTRFEITNIFLHTEDPLEEGEYLALIDKDVVREGDASVRKDRRTYYRNTARTRLSHRFGQDDSIYVGFLYGLLRNDDSQEEDNDRYSPSMGLNYWFGPTFGIESDATYTRGEFDRDNDFVGDPTDDFHNYAGTIRFIGRTKTRFSAFAQYSHIYRDYDGDIGFNDDYMVYAPSAGFTYVVEKGLTLRVGPGYYYQQVEGGEDKQGYFGNGQIDKTWSYRRGFINLTALTGLAQNDFGADNIGLERFGAIQGSARYDFLRNLSGDINGRYRYSDRIGSADQGDDDTGNNVHRFNVGAGLSFLPLKWMTIRLSYSFNKLDSEEETDEYDEHRGFLQITLTPSQPYRYTE